MRIKGKRRVRVLSAILEPNSGKLRTERFVVEHRIPIGTSSRAAPTAAVMTSIWLRPEPSQEQVLQSLIRSVATEQGTFPFAPHLTVCGPLKDPATLDAVIAYIKECGLLPLRVAKTAVTGAVITPFRAVFIEVENTPELRQFRERLRGILGAPPLIPPHISLLYTLDAATQAPRPDLDAGRLAAIAARCAAAIPDTHFLLGRPVAHSGGGLGKTDLRSWQIVSEL